MPFSVLFSVFGMGVALMGIRIRLSGQVKDKITPSSMVALSGSRSDLVTALIRINDLGNMKIDAATIAD